MNLLFTCQKAYYHQKLYTDTFQDVNILLIIDAVDVFSGDDRLIFGGGVKYTAAEITGLQNFFRFIKAKKQKLPKEAYDKLYT